MQLENTILQSDTLAKKWAFNTLVGIALYIILEIIVLLLPPYYSISQAESDLAVGPYGIIMNIDFIIRGLLSGYLILALYRFSRNSAFAIMGIVFFAVFCVCSFLLAFFNTDVSDSLTRVQHTFHGQIHQMLTGIAFICAPIGILIISLSFQGIARFKSFGVSSLIAAVICVLSFINLGQAGFYAQNSGIFERICVGSILFWCGLVAFNLVRRSNSTVKFHQ
jgi:hypothetical protein